MPPSDKPPAHADVQIAGIETPFRSFLRIDVVRFRHRLFAGGWSAERTYEVMRRGAAVAIVLYDPLRDAVVLIEQFRLAPLYAGFSPWQIEVIAGLVDHDDEPDDEVARRETREEADLAVIGELIPIQRYMPSPGATDERVMLFCGRVDAAGAGGLHGLAAEHEDIRVVVKSFAEVEAMVDAGRIDTGHTLLCLYWLIRNRDRVRREWGAAPSSPPQAGEG
jgi:ADP-ribose pyrophosphatase